MMDIVDRGFKTIGQNYALPCSNCLSSTIYRFFYIFSSIMSFDKNLLLCIGIRKLYHTIFVKYFQCFKIQIKILSYWLFLFFLSRDKRITIIVINFDQL